MRSVQTRPAAAGVPTAAGGRYARSFGVRGVSAALLCVMVAVVAGVPIGAARGQFVAPELEPNRGWLNTDRPLRFGEELKGHVVLLDFWTYCCINCLHILPDLEWLERRYADEPFVVIGVHSAKFDTEAERRSIRHAMFRYDIGHPVVIDDDFRIWRAYQARAWPTFVLIDPEGNIVGATSGEGQRDVLSRYIARTLEEHRAKGTLAKQKIEIELDEPLASPTGLRYPGKVLAVAPKLGQPGRLFIADSSHDRVIVATYPDERGVAELIDAYGGGSRGLADGSPEEARFNDPQGFAFDAEKNLLYVADTKNHAVRVIDLGARRVRTLVGTGEQGRDRAGGKNGLLQAISSPWALALDAKRNKLYIAMAGPHQLWQTDLTSTVTRVLAGSGAENVYDGPARGAALAQPSGLALSTDGDTLYFTDTEGSAVRALDLEKSYVTTLIGRAVQDPLVESSLFDFGDIDGGYPDARLQHAIGITLWPTDPFDAKGDRLLIADTYNDKLKLVNPHEKTVETWAGTDRDAAVEAGQLRLQEPAGVSFARVPPGNAFPARLFVADTNNHRVVMIDPATRAWTEVAIDGLRPPGVRGEGSGLATIVPREEQLEAAVSPAAGTLTLELTAVLPGGYKANPEAPAAVRVSRLDGDALTGVLTQRTYQLPEGAPFPLEIGLPEGAANGEVLVELSFAYCGEDGALCIPHDVAWRVRFEEGGGAPRLSAPVVAPELD